MYFRNHRVTHIEVSKYFSGLNHLERMAILEQIISDKEASLSSASPSSAEARANIKRDNKRKFSLSMDDLSDNKENITPPPPSRSQYNLNNYHHYNENYNKHFINQIENQIIKTFEFCEKVLIRRRDSVIKELHEVLLHPSQENSVEKVQFVTNLFTIKSCIQDTFGYINLPILQQNETKTEDETLKPKHISPLQKFSLNKFRERMQLNFKFGGTGHENNKFTEPNGIALDKHRNIIIADSNSNYMKVFDCHGCFKFKFGIEKLLFPNKVACHKQTGSIVVIERKPAHEIKIFNKIGEFLCRFGSGILISPRGVCIDRKSRIVILESKVMRILIFSLNGDLIKGFDISKHFRFANSICVSNKEDKIFISDNLSHCIKIFNYDGEFLNEIGGPGLTNFPTSVDIDSSDQLVVTDNYNSFNLTILSENGELINAYESKIKHSRILDVELIDDHSIMFSSRDNTVYVYNF